MPKRVPTKSVIITRNGRQKLVPADKVFDFTSEELEQLNKTHKGLLRTPRTEGEPEETVDVDNLKSNKAETDGNKAAAAKPAAKVDTKPAAKADKDGGL